MSSVSSPSTEFEVFGKLPSVSVPEIHEAEFEQLVRATALAHVGQSGRQILLRAPGSGYGRTHLLSRLRLKLANWCVFAVRVESRGSLTAQSVTEDIISSLLSAIPEAGGLTDLDLLSRKLFAVGLEPLVNSGDVPCDDRETAINALQRHPIETFDFHDEEALTAQWTLENHEVLEPRMALEIAERCQSSHREVSFWLHSLFEYAMSAPSAPLRADTLTRTLSKAFSDDSESLQLQRLSTLLKMISVLHPCGLVLDGTSALGTMSHSAISAATLLCSLRELCPGLFIVVSTSDDVWNSTYGDTLPEGLRSRVMEQVIELSPLTGGSALTLAKAFGLEETDDLKKTLEGENSARKIIRLIKKELATDETKEEEDKLLESLFTPPPIEEFEPISNDGDLQPEEGTTDSEEEAPAYPAFSFAQAIKDVEEQSRTVPVSEDLTNLKPKQVPLETTAVPVRSAANRNATRNIAVSQKPLPPTGPPKLPSDDESEGESSEDAPSTQTSSLEVKPIHYPLRHGGNIAAPRPFMQDGDEEEIPRNKVKIKADTKRQISKNYPPVAPPSIPPRPVRGQSHLLEDPESSPTPEEPLPSSATTSDFLVENVKAGADDHVPTEEENQKPVPSGPPVFRATPRPEFSLDENDLAEFKLPEKPLETTFTTDGSEASVEKPRAIFAAKPLRPERLPGVEDLPSVMTTRVGQKKALTGQTAAWGKFPNKGSKKKSSVAVAAAPTPISPMSNLIADGSEKKPLFEQFTDSALKQPVEEGETETPSEVDEEEKVEALLHEFRSKYNKD